MRVQPLKGRVVSLPKDARRLPPYSSGTHGCRHLASQKSRTDCGQSPVEIAVIGGVALAAFFVAVLVVLPRLGVVGNNQKKLSATELAYVQAVATQRAAAYIAAVSTLAASAAPTVAPDSPTIQPTSGVQGVAIGQPPSPSPVALPPNATTTGNFVFNGLGQARIPIPIKAPVVYVRVSIDPSSAPVGSWVWCFNSSFGLAPNPFDVRSEKWRLSCFRDGLYDPVTGYIDTSKSVQISEAWPPDATYFADMYCFSPCVWQVEVRQ